jgi:benzodiazapine receptor
LNRDIIRQIMVVTGVIALIVVNALANILPFNGLNTGQISDRFDVLFVPAGYVFSIWGLIYLGLLAYAVYQALPSQRTNPRLRSIGGLFVWSCLANIVWLFLWHYLVFVGTIFAMVALLVLLIVIYQRLGIGRVRVSKGERWTTHLTFSIYLGWICVATIANAADLLWYLGWNGAPLPASWWATMMLAVGVVLAFLMTIFRGDVAFILVLAWAYIGIAIKQADTTLVANAAWAATVALFVLAGAAALRIPNRSQIEGIE